MTGFNFCLAGADTYKLPMFSPHEHFFSPDTATDIPNNIYNIPRGNPHISHIFQLYPHLPKSPQYVFIKTDALGHNFIRGISSLDCPSFISIADTHIYTDLLSVYWNIFVGNFTYLSVKMIVITLNGIIDLVFGIPYGCLILP